MCGCPCQKCNGYIYSHGPGKYKNYCFTCYVKIENIPKNQYAIDKNGRFHSKYFKSF